MPFAAEASNRTVVRVALAIAAALSLTVACTNDDASLPEPPTTGGFSPTATYPVLDAADPNATKRALDDASSSAKDIIEAVKDLLALEAAEAACLAQRLDLDADLRSSLADDPTKSPRYQDLTDLAADCVRATTGAVNFVNSVQQQSSGTLTNEQLECLRTGYGGLAQADIEAIIQAGLEPTSPNTDAIETIKRLLTTCGVDPATLAP